MGMVWADFRSPFGRGWVGVRDGALVELHFDGAAPAGAERRRLPVARKIERYFAGERVRFDEPVRIDGLSDFAKRVYDAVRAIPPGQTRTYGEVARAAGRPRAARAVGNLMRRNPVCLAVP